MAIIHLYDNTTGPPSLNSTSVQLNMGVAFVVDTDGTIEGLRAYIGNGGPFYNAWSPKYLSLWDESTGARVDTLGALAGATALGWAEYLFATPYQVYAGERYRVAWEPGIATAPWYLPQIASTSLSTPPTGLSWASTPACQQATHTDPPQYPASSATAATWCDVIFNTDQVSAAGINPRSLNNGLADWLISTGDNTHQTDGLPWLIKTELDATKTLVDGISTATTAASSSGTGLTGFLVAMTPSVLAAMGTFFANSNTVLEGSGAGGGGTAFTAISHQIASTIVPAGSFPGTGWAMTAETDFTDAIAYSQPADLYVVDIYTSDPALGGATFDGVDAIFRLGWWTPLNGTYLQERRFFDFAHVHLVDGGRRMNGALIALPRTGTGHVQAWTFTP